LRPHNITLRQMRAFISLARHGSFRAAASAFNLSQSALSIAIRQMEDELGVSLFDRTTRRVELTSAGRSLLPRIERMLAELDLMLDETHNAADLKSGRVVVASVFSVATEVLPLVVARFRRIHPGVRVALLDYTASAVQEAVRQGRADIGVCARNELDGDLDFERVAADPFVALLPARHPLVPTPEVGLGDLVDHPIVAMAKGTQIRTLIDSALHARGLSVRPAYEATQPAAVEAMVAAGLGASILPRISVSARNPRIVIRVLAKPGLERELGLVARTGRARPALVQDLRLHIIDYFRDRIDA